MTRERISEMRTSAPPLLAIFRSRLQGDLLARIMLQPDSLTVTALAKAVSAPVPTVHREVARLEDAGLLVTRRIGRARLVSANEANPATPALRELVLVSFGPRQVIAEEFAELPGVKKVSIFGSWASRYAGEAGRMPGDVDVLVVGDVDRQALYDAADRAQGRLARPVNPTRVSEAAWLAGTDPFLATLASRPMIDILAPERAA